MVKYGYNRIIFVAIPPNSNNVTLVKSGTSSSVAIALCNSFYVVAIIMIIAT
jgi:hypothetical protein